MPADPMLTKVKTALRISTSALDGEVQDLIDAALDDLGIAGVRWDGEEAATAPPLVVRAVITYCRANFTITDDYDRLKASYDEQKAQLRSATGYTDWRDGSWSTPID